MLIQASFSPKGRNNIFEAWFLFPILDLQLSSQNFTFPKVRECASWYVIGRMLYHPIQTFLFGDRACKSSLFRTQYLFHFCAFQKKHSPLPNSEQPDAKISRAIDRLAKLHLFSDYWHTPVNQSIDWWQVDVNTWIPKDFLSVMRMITHLLGDNDTQKAGYWLLK